MTDSMRLWNVSPVESVSGIWTRGELHVDQTLRGRSRTWNDPHRGCAASHGHGDERQTTAFGTAWHLPPGTASVTRGGSEVVSGS